MSKATGVTAKVLLVDDHKVVRHGIARIVEDESDMEVVGEAGDAEEALEAVQRLCPDVVLMDISIPGISGIDATRKILQVKPDTRVLILTVHDREDFLFRSLQAGATGYVLKGAEIDDLLKAIRTVVAGEVFVYPRMTTKLVQDYLSRTESETNLDQHGELTAREWEILRLLADEHTNQQTPV